MIATTWLCPVLTLLCATKLVYTAQRGSYAGYPLDDMDSQLLQNDYFRSKRNKPSLSIVNPLDVLRQRLLLEIARRQMKENSRQVELNRAILKNVGKRMVNKYATSPLTAALYEDVQESQQRQQQQQQMQHFQPYEYELIPTTLIFDYLQQQEQQQRHPWLPYETSATQFANNYINNANEGSAFASSSSSSDADNETGEENGEQDIMIFNGVLGNNDKHSLKHTQKQSNNNNEQSTTSSVNEPQREKSIMNSNNRNEDTKRLTLINNPHHPQLHHHKNDLNLDLNDDNDANPMLVNTNANDFKNNEINDNAGDYQIQRYLYHLHKNQNHLTRK